MSSNLSRFYDFGPFRLDLTEHLLLRAGKTVALTPKAFDTLVMLVRNNGRTVAKDDLLKSIWPETFVEEATLAQNIFTLRKALGGSDGQQYIQTIPKRGYRFVASVTEVMDEGANVPVDQFGTVMDTIRHGGTVARDRAICSLAVLPLINMSADPNAEYLSDGITESIVNSLSLLPELQIKACSTVIHYKGRELDPQEAGRELAVGSVLIGRILQSGENLQIRMELVDVTNGWQLWGEEYNQKLPDIHNFQVEVAKDISEKLRLKLTGEEWQRLLKPRMQRFEAHQLYLKGRYFLNMRTREGYEKARDCFEQAIEFDSSFALAYSGLADSYILFDFYGLTAPWETMPKARAAAVCAVELDNKLSEAHTTLAAIKLLYDHDLPGAEREFKLAIRLNPRYSRAHDGYAHCLLEMGQIENSLAECKLALELDPFDPEINQHLGWYYLFNRQYDLAIEQLKKTLEMGPNVYRARILLGIAYVQKKSFSQAIAEFLRAARLEKTPVLSGFLGHAYAMAGKKEALEILDDLLGESKHSYVPPYSIALIYTGLGKRDEAVEWLQKAFVEHSHWRGWLRLTPELDSLRSDPRFTEISEGRLKPAQY
jgi:DNA-binding winged helix-turn-helix (wHTH) protein/TolB-like protein/Flp pilus assembly protein TadD